MALTLKKGTWVIRKWTDSPQDLTFWFFKIKFSLIQNWEYLSKLSYLENGYKVHYWLERSTLFIAIFRKKKVSGKVPGPCYNHWDLFMFHWSYGFYCFSAFWLGSSEVIASKKCCASRSVVSNSLWLKDCSPPCSSIHGILQARILEWVKAKLFSPVWLFATPWTVAHQAPPSMGFSRQEYWSRLPFPSPGDLPNPGIEPRSPALQADALTSEPPGNPFFRGSSRPRDQTWVSCTAGRFFIVWATMASKVLGKINK